MTILCQLGFHKPIRTNPEKGLMSEVRCDRKWCNKLLSEEKTWPDPPLPILPFSENPKCPVCRSVPNYVYFCQGFRWDLLPPLPVFSSIYTCNCPYGEKGHLHRKCSCEFKWVEKTAIDTEGA